MHNEMSHATEHGDGVPSRNASEIDGTADQASLRVTDVVQAAVSPRPVLMALEAVHAGFPSVAQDYFAGDFSLDENVITNPDTTFILHVAGDSMEGAGIFDGDLLIVDRSIAPAAGDIVVAILDDELTVKRLLVHGSTPVLHPENARYPNFIPGNDESLSIWGVVTGNFHSQHDALSSRHSAQVPRTSTPAPHRADTSHSSHHARVSSYAAESHRSGQLHQDAQRYPRSGWGA
ncbi:LexA family protein [Bifidobacterium aquikefiricola]|uniref:S24 family peptidase n=2 Tax=Bifidobacterium TaxID=1678 RepID=A0AB39U3Z3_9BIFI